jgi:hypothetical protein
VVDNSLLKKGTLLVSRWVGTGNFLWVTPARRTVIGMSSGVGVLRPGLSAWMEATSILVGRVSHQSIGSSQSTLLDGAIRDHWTGQTRSEVSGARSLGSWDRDAGGTFVCRTACTHFDCTVWSWTDSTFDDSTEILAVINAFNRALHALG